MTDRIRMTHPRLPDQPIWVRPGGVASRQMSGWVEEPEPEPVPEEDTEPRTEAEPSRETKRRRRRTTNEGDED